MKRVDQLALAKFFGPTSKSRFQKNREWLYLLSEETFAYQGQSEKDRAENQGAEKKETAQRTERWIASNDNSRRV